MQSHSPTTPFGRRSLTLAHVASQMVATARPPEKVVHKWKIFQRYLRRAAAPRRVRAFPLGIERTTNVPSGDCA